MTVFASLARAETIDVCHVISHTCVSSLCVCVRVCVLCGQAMGRVQLKHYNRRMAEIDAVRRFVLTFKTTRCSFLLLFSAAAEALVWKR